jgi:hypothetical protein
MSCNITQGITTGCNNSIGGIQQVFIANGYTAYIESGGQITQFQGVAEWFQFDVDNGGASFTETYEVNQNGNILGFRQSVTLQLNGLSAEIQTIVKEMAESTSMVVVVRDNNNSYWTLGIDRGAFLETGSSTTGTAYTDIKAATLTITGIEQESTKLVSSIALGQYDQVRIYSAIDFGQTCAGTFPLDYTYNIGNDTLPQAKCKYDDTNSYLVADPLGCYPQSNVILRGTTPIKAVPVGTVLGVGTQLYALNGTPYSGSITFFYAPTNQSFVDTGSAIQLNSNIMIGRTSGGVIVEWDNQANITCTP